MRKENFDDSLIAPMDIQMGMSAVTGKEFMAEPSIATWRFGKHAMAKPARGYFFGALLVALLVMSSDQVIAADSERESEFMGRASSAFSSKDYDGAIEAYTEVLKINPRRADAYIYRGDAWRAKKEGDKAIAD